MINRNPEIISISKGMEIGVYDLPLYFLQQASNTKQKIIRILLSVIQKMVKEGKDPNRYYKYIVKEFAHELEIRNKNQYKITYAYLRELCDLVVEVRLEDGQIKRFKFLEDEKDKQGQGFAIIKPSEGTTKYVSELAQQVNTYTLDRIKNTTSVYSIPLYEMCLRNQDKTNALPDTFKISFEDLRKALGADDKESYVIFQNFKVRILDKAIKEINEYLELNGKYPFNYFELSYEKEYDGKKISDNLFIKFTMKYKGEKEFVHTAKMKGYEMLENALEELTVIFRNKMQAYKDNKNKNLDYLWDGIKESDKALWKYKRIIRTYKNQQTDTEKSRTEINFKTAYEKAGKPIDTDKFVIVLNLDEECALHEEFIETYNEILEQYMEIQDQVLKTTSAEKQLPDSTEEIAEEIKETAERTYAKILLIRALNEIFEEDEAVVAKVVSVTAIDQQLTKIIEGRRKEIKEFVDGKADKIKDEKELKEMLDELVENVVDDFWSEC